MLIRTMLLMLLMAGCTAAPAPAPTNIPRILPPEVPAGGLLHVPLEAAGTPEAMPMLIIRSSIIDDETDEPVHGDVYVVDGIDYRAPVQRDLRYAGVTAFELGLFGDINAWLIVVAPGYETWRLRLSFRLKMSRELTGAVRLRRVVEDKS